ncbi:MAG: hypothetical protein HPY89_00530 [Pelotomaculum sp.]|nr:hypothetical protein [Pelotomaculum sp.]
MYPEVLEFLESLGLSERNKAYVNFIHELYEYAESGKTGGDLAGLVLNLADMVEQENLNGEQAVRVVVLGMVKQLEKVFEAFDLSEALSLMSDIASVVLYLRLTQRVDGDFLDSISGMLANVTLLVDAACSRQDGADYLN